MKDNHPSGPRPAPSPSSTRGGMPSVVVVGGTGFLGAAFVRTLDDRGHRVAVLSRSAARVPERFPGRQVEPREGDVRRIETLGSAFRGARTVIQCAQFPGFPVEDPARGRTFMRVDAEGTANVVAAAREEGVTRVVYLSGAGADPDAAESWFRAKGIAETAVRSSGLAYAILRPSWVYGPEDRSLNRFADLIRRVPLLFPQLGDGTQSLNPVFVRDVAGAVAECVERDPLRSATLEIGGPLTYTMDAIVRLLMEALERPKPIVHVPLGLALVGAALLEPLPGQLLSRDAVRFVTQASVADNRELRRLFPDLSLTPMPEALPTYVGT